MVKHHDVVGRYVTIEVDDCEYKVFYLQNGKGIPLICQHTAGCHNHQWRGLLEDEEITIYESGAIVEYLIARHSNGELKPKVSDPAFPNYLQWFHYCEGMIMPPMNTIVVHTLILPEERRNEEVLRQAKNLLTKALLPVNQLLEKNKYLIDKFSGVDFMLGHSLYMSNKLKCVPDEMINIKNYLNLISEREAFQKAINS